MSKRVELVVPEAVFNSLTKTYGKYVTRIFCGHENLVPCQRKHMPWSSSETCGLATCKDCGENVG